MAGYYAGETLRLTATVPDGPGVAQGTVQYHLGTCYEKLGRFSDATQAWRKPKTVRPG